MAVSAVYSAASKKRIQICMEDFSDQTLLHNPKWTVEALENILENGIKYSPEGTKLTISVLPMNLYTRITIEDQGAGIPKEEYNQIFRRFYRGKGVEQEKGNGLGLYLSQLIINREKGYITVSSVEGQGSRFQVFLPNALEG